MPPRVRKLALAVHLTTSIGWIGAVFVYLALGVTAGTSRDLLTVRGAWIGMELAGWYAIVPLALGSLLTGVVMAVGTKWGLFRYYWVVFALVFTTLATVVLILHMPTVSAASDTARHARGERLYGLGGDLFHPTVGLVVLLAILVLNVYKPPGMTRYGWRRRFGQPNSKTGLQRI
jgi:hypothetical protein